MSRALNHFVGIRRPTAGMCAVVIAFGTVFASGAAAADAQSVTDAERRRAEIALAGLSNTMEKLVSGEFRLRIYQHLEAGLPEELSHKHIYSAFDMRSGKLRFDRNMQMQVIEFPDGSPRDRDAIMAAERRIEPHNRKFIKTPERTLRWGTSHVHQVTSGDADDGDSKALPFYVHSLPILSGTPPELQTLADVLELFNTMRMTSVSEAGEVTAITWVGGPNDWLKRTIWIDGARDYLPQRVVIWLRANAEADWGEPFGVTTCEWETRNGAWFPKRLHYGKRVGNAQSTEMGTYEELTFEWLSVNEPIAERVFTARGFDLDMFAAVVDNRLGTRIVVETVGPLVNHLPPAETMLPAPDRRLHWLWLLGVNAALVIAGVLLYRRHRHRRREADRK